MILNIRYRRMASHQWKWGIRFDLDNKVRGIAKLDKSMEGPGFQDDPEQSTGIVRESKNLKDEMDTYRTLEQQYGDIQAMIQMGYGENDSSLIPEIEEILEQLEETLENIRMKLLLSGEYDPNNAILYLNTETSGTESCDWCNILCRMYRRQAENKDFKAHVLDFLDDEEMGIKSITVRIDSENAYRYPRSEHGVYRLVRISPFNSTGKRQTSFVSCDVTPNIEEDIDIKVSPSDIRVGTYRSGGAGGQHISKTSSVIRITHFPTRTVVTCQNERSQFQDKERAIQMLKAELLIVKREEQAAKAVGIRGGVKDIGWGSRIRSYVLQPYTMVKNHHTDEESGNVDAALDGAIDNSINAYLCWIGLECPDKNVREDE